MTSTIWKCNSFVELIRLADSYNLVLIPFLSFVMLAFGMTHVISKQISLADHFCAALC